MKSLFEGQTCFMIEPVDLYARQFLSIQNEAFSTLNGNSKAEKFDALEALKKWKLAISEIVGLQSKSIAITNAGIQKGKDPIFLLKVSLDQLTLFEKSMDSDRKSVYDFSKEILTVAGV
ncbi:hypothetical protein EBR96_09350, partial [bacterium]|nr:hypothetical protein [bacterium]